jgi:hypothetical protein
MSCRSTRFLRLVQVSPEQSLSPSLLGEISASNRSGDEQAREDFRG